MVDAQLAYDAAQMSLLLEHPAWKVLEKYIDMNDKLATVTLKDHRRPMEEIRFAQGALESLALVRRLPEHIIQLERNSRQ